MMRRREFLHVFTLAATGAALTGCSGSDNSPEAVVITPITPPPSSPQIVAGRAFFPQSVASGDPQASSVMLWTRVSDGALPTRLRVDVSNDSTFTTLVATGEFPVAASSDFCLKVRVTNLLPKTRYYYRFLYLKDGSLRESQVGRTKTAPALTDTTAVRFAVLSCQDYIGRFYNTLFGVIDEDLDFVVHVGDYIYETVGDPSFQGTGGERAIRFDDSAGALTLGSANAPFQAARSLSNYRQLYRSYRSDETLQKLHERFPMVAIWDDHEFSDDSWQANATYTDGRQDERDEARKRNAEQAYFEFMPIDTTGIVGGTVPLSSVEVNAAQLFPNTNIYRDFRFGANVQLIATDYRTFRPDHLIPEDGFPGTVVVDRAVLTQLLGSQGVSYDAVRNNFSPYINIDAEAFAPYKPVLIGVLTQAYAQQGLAIAAAQAKAVGVVRGNLATTPVNALLQQYNAAVPPAQQVPLLSAALIATLDTGIAYFTMGKQSLFSDLGARYFVVKDTYDLFAASRFVFGGAATQNAFGQAQDTRLRAALRGSTARWKFVASSVSFTSMVLDLRAPQLGVPAPFNQRFYLNVDQWDGFPNQRAEYMSNVFGPANGVVLLSGDIHASFATQHAPTIAEFTTPAVSSATFSAIIRSTAASDPNLSALASQLLPAFDQLLVAANNTIRYTQSTRHGLTIVTADASSVRARFVELPEARAANSSYANPAALAGEFVRRELLFDAQGLRVV